MDFWAGMIVGVTSAVAAGGLGVVGVLLTNRAARRREEVARQATLSREETRKRADREHELRNALRELSLAIRRSEVRYDRGLALPADIAFEVPVQDVMWRLARLNQDYRYLVQKEFDGAQAQVFAGFVSDGLARFDALIRSLEEWAVRSREPLQIPAAPDDIVDEFAASPRCPDCSILLREVPGGWECPECGHREDVMSGPFNRPFDGPVFPGA